MDNVATFLFLFIVFASWGLFEYLYYCDHRRSLTPEEIKKVISIRKQKLSKSLNSHKGMSFPLYNIVPDRDFKSSMKGSGEYTSMDMNVRQFPSYVSALLKGKKNEWIVVGFADKTKVKYMWYNRGKKKTVGMNIGYDSIIDIAKQENCNMVLCLHNHPNPNPQRYNSLLASPADYSSAKEMSEKLNPEGISLIEFVCERGRFIIYHRSFPIVPVSQEDIDRITAEVTNTNGRSARDNYRLHREMGMFSGWTFKFKPFRKPASDTPIIQNTSTEPPLPEPQVEHIDKGSTSSAEKPDRKNNQYVIKLMQIVNNMDTLSGVDFEKLCKGILSILGFENMSMTPATGDHGVDLIGWKFNKKYVFQCKRYDSNVGNKAVQEIYTGKKLYAASEAVVITNSHFTKQAVDEAGELGVVLWDREKFQEKAYQALELLSGK